MRKFSFLFLLLTYSVLAQSQFQIGLFGGTSNYLGDLADKLYQNTRGAFGLTAGYQITDRINLRAGLTFAKVAGADSLLKPQDLRLRNLSFQSNISEFSAVAEFNTFDMNYKRWSPYVFGGLAVFHFNPYTFDRQNRKTYLQPLSTEGEGLPGYSQKPYALTQLALPFGGGVKYNISEHVRIALELGIRKTFTDYLDDVSGNYPDPNDLLRAKGQEAVDLSYRGDEVPGGNPGFPQKGITRGSPKYKDYYYFTGLHLVYQFGEGSNAGSNGGGGIMGRRKGYGCPTVF
jgi:hypothetical protein